MPLRPGSPAIVNAMSIDVEDYFQVSAFDDVVARSAWGGMESRVVENTGRLLDVFAEFGVRATFFVLGWVGERHPALLRRIAAEGHEIASHGYGHELVYRQTPDAFRADVRRARAVLEDQAGRPVVGYRAPSYSITERSLWALDVLVEEGCEFDSSIFPVRHDRYGIPGSPRHPYLIARPAGSLIELPPATVVWGGANLPVAGGGYFRLLPYTFTRWGFTRINESERQPAVFYLHPWEIDPDQPRLPVGAITGFRHYRNLDRTESRLRRLLTDFAFDTVGRVAAAAANGLVAVPTAVPVALSR